MVVDMQQCIEEQTYESSMQINNVTLLVLNRSFCIDHEQKRLLGPSINYVTPNLAIFDPPPFPHVTLSQNSD